MTELYGHVSDLRLDRLFAGELSPAAAEHVLAHTDACARCQLRMHELIAWRIRFRALPRPRLTPPPHQPWYGLYVAVVVALAGITIATGV
jgi:anti-sigma factor RsiW